MPYFEQDSNDIHIKLDYDCSTGSATCPVEKHRQRLRAPVQLQSHLPLCTSTCHYHQFISQRAKSSGALHPLHCTNSKRRKSSTMACSWEQTFSGAIPRASCHCCQHSTFNSNPSSGSGLGCLLTGSRVRLHSRAGRSVPRGTSRRKSNAPYLADVRRTKEARRAEKEPGLVRWTPLSLSSSAPAPLPRCCLTRVPRILLSLFPSFSLLSP